MTKEEFGKRMREIADMPRDPEAQHSKADDLLVSALRQLGYSDGCDVYEVMDRWCA